MGSGRCFALFRTVTFHFCLSSFERSSSKTGLPRATPSSQMISTPSRYCFFMIRSASFFSFVFSIGGKLTRSGKLAKGVLLASGWLGFFRCDRWRRLLYGGFITNDPPWPVESKIDILRFCWPGSSPLFAMPNFISCGLILAICSMVLTSPLLRTSCVFSAMPLMIVKSVFGFGLTAFGGAASAGGLGLAGGIGSLTLAAGLFGGVCVFLGVPDFCELLLRLSRNFCISSSVGGPLLSCLAGSGSVVSSTVTAGSNKPS